MVLRFGQAVGATKADYTEFDRKNYFYPDIPKAYQISQYAFPFLTGGVLQDIELTRVHLEEDTARSSHENPAGSEVDFNRAGVPLMELVTEPVIHDAKTAGDFARELQLILRTLGISEANMEKGEMRVEANISVSTDPDQMSSTYVEIKNINSFKAVESAIDFEIARQIKLIEAGESLKQETRGWDENANQTFSQRSKETAKDYRYFPDPDIPKIKTSEISAFRDSVLAEKIPVLPIVKRAEYKSYGLTEQMTETIISDNKLDTLFRQVVSILQPEHGSAIALAANYISVDLSNSDLLDTIACEPLAELMRLVHAGEVGSRGAKDLLPKLANYTGSVVDLARSEGVIQNSDPAALQLLITAVVQDHPTQVAEYQAGKESVLKFLIGQGMKLSKGAANPAVLEQLLVDEISK
jgi:aspartyl-tRNA(Asn)/glutamyl-tRNA(Gln) amidotransferase subunit B